jgi:hypothetical protein
MLELLAVPHNGIPYVHMGFSTVLYSRSLLSSARREFRPSNQYICLNFNPSCLRFVKMCLRHVSLLSERSNLDSRNFGWISPGSVTWRFAYLHAVNYFRKTFCISRLGFTGKASIPSVRSTHSHNENKKALRRVHVTIFPWKSNTY